MGVGLLSFFPYEKSLLPSSTSSTDAVPQGFYVQVREIEAQTGCRFDDTFMIENERAIDYSKVWISTFQSLEKPCAGLGKSKPEGEERA